MTGSGFTVAIDGPAAAGKGTVSKAVAAHFGFAHLDTGLLYRAVGAKVLAGADAIDAALTLVVDDLDDANLRTSDVAQAASKVAVIAEVRAALLDFQRSFATRAGGAVLDGRDIGTVICPEAEAKLFIMADSKVRMERRARQLESRGLVVDRYALYHQIEERDARDMANPHGGFYKAADAHLLDTTLLDIEAALRAAIAIVDGSTADKAGR